MLQEILTSLHSSSHYFPGMELCVILLIVWCYETHI